MSAAVADVKQNGISIRKAAAKYSVPPTTLNNITTGKIQEGARWGGAYLKKDEMGCWKMPKKELKLELAILNTTFSDVHLNLRKKEGHSLRVQYHQKYGGCV